LDGYFNFFKYLCTTVLDETINLELYNNTQFVDWKTQYSIIKTTCYSFWRERLSNFQEMWFQNS